MSKGLELYLDFCEECFQMTNHIGDDCQKCEAKKKNASYHNDFDDEDDEQNYRIKK